MAGPKVHDGAVTGPVSKRQKIQSNAEESSAPLVRQSKIFAPFRVSSTGVLVKFCARLTEHRQ
ncbi:WD repeat containing protein 36 [Pyrenophora tritici-repentis]|nr:WD repeat containing protein 36 [Pyrenophora tritici-repentis]